MLVGKKNEKTKTNIIVIGPRKNRKIKKMQRNKE